MKANDHCFVEEDRQQGEARLKLYRERKPYRQTD